MSEVFCPFDDCSASLVIVGATTNGAGVAWNNLPTKLNERDERPDDFPESLSIGVRRRVWRRHANDRHSDQMGTAEYAALTAIWQPYAANNWAGGRAAQQRKAAIAVGCKAATAAKRKASPGGNLPSSKAPKAKLVTKQKTTLVKKRGATSGKRAPVRPC